MRRSSRYARRGARFDVVRCVICQFKAASRHGVFCPECRSDLKELASEWSGVA